jgi:hypothetical protein
MIKKYICGQHCVLCCSGSQPITQGIRKPISNKTNTTLMWLFSSSFDPQKSFFTETLVQHGLSMEKVWWTGGSLTLLLYS